MANNTNTERSFGEESYNSNFKSKGSNQRGHKSKGSE